MIMTEDYSAGVMNIFSILIQVLMTLVCAQDKNRYSSVGSVMGRGKHKGLHAYTCYCLIVL